MPRAPRQCPSPGCDNRITTTRYCEDHTVHHWTRPGNQRGPEHARWRRAVLSRDKGICQIKGPRCTRRATEADHKINIAEGGPEFDINNGQAACSPCHQDKTQAEATRGLRRRFGKTGTETP